MQEEKEELEMIDVNQPISKSERKKKRETEEEKEQPFNLWKEIISFLGTMLCAAVIVILLKEFLIINAFIPSGSMEYTIQPNDRLIGNRLAYVTGEPERGDIIIFKYPDDESQLFVKRIIGLPGETITIEEAKVYVNGELLEEEYLKEEWIVDNGPYTFEIPEGSYFVLGDNRNNSKDARYWNHTYLEEDKILGKAVFRYWPLDSIGVLE